MMASCSGESHKSVTDERLAKCETQLSLLLRDAYDADSNPRTVDLDGATHWIDNSIFDWTEGFFPGTC